MGRIKQEVKVNESVFILEDIMMTLYEKYRFNLPPKLRDEMEKQNISDLMIRTGLSDIMK